MNPSTVFISYSHKDENWKNRLVIHLGVLEKQGILNLWDDRRIAAGDEWQKEIESAINSAHVAVLLISANFLTSQFILNKEVPHLLERREKDGVRIIPLIIQPCAWQQVPWLARLQARPKDGKPLSGGDEHQINADLASLAEEIAKIIGSGLGLKLHLPQVIEDYLVAVKEYCENLPYLTLHDIRPPKTLSEVYVPLKTRPERMWKEGNFVITNTRKNMERMIVFPYLSQKS